MSEIIGILNNFENFNIISDPEGFNIKVYIKQNEKLIILGDLIGSTFSGSDAKKNIDDIIKDRKNSPVENYKDYLKKFYNSKAFNIRNLIAIVEQKTHNCFVAMGNRDLNKLKLLPLLHFKEEDEQKFLSLVNNKNFNEILNGFKKYEKKFLITHLLDENGFSPFWDSKRNNNNEATEITKWTKKEKQKKYLKTKSYSNPENNNPKNNNLDNNLSFYERFEIIFTDTINERQVLYTIPLELQEINILDKNYDIYDEKNKEHNATIVLLFFKLALMDKQKITSNNDKVDKILGLLRDFYLSEYTFICTYLEKKSLETESLEKESLEKESNLCLFSHGGISKEFLNIPVNSDYKFTFTKSVNLEVKVEDETTQAAELEAQQRQAAELEALRLKAQKQAAQQRQALNQAEQQRQAKEAQNQAEQQRQAQEAQNQAQAAELEALRLKAQKQAAQQRQAQNQALKAQRPAKRINVKQEEEDALKLHFEIYLKFIIDNYNINDKINDIINKKTNISEINYLFFFDYKTEDYNSNIANINQIFSETGKGIEPRVIAKTNKLITDINHENYLKVYKYIIFTILLLKIGKNIKNFVNQTQIDGIIGPLGKNEFNLKNTPENIQLIKIQDFFIYIKKIEIDKIHKDGSLINTTFTTFSKQFNYYNEIINKIMKSKNEISKELNKNGNVIAKQNIELFNKPPQKGGYYLTSAIDQIFENTIIKQKINNYNQNYKNKIKNVLNTNYDNNYTCIDSDLLYILATTANFSLQLKDEKDKSKKFTHLHTPILPGFINLRDSVVFCKKYNVYNFFGHVPGSYGPIVDKFNNTNENPTTITSNNTYNINCDISNTLLNKFDTVDITKPNFSYLNLDLKPGLQDLRLFNNTKIYFINKEQNIKNIQTILNTDKMLESNNNHDLILNYLNFEHIIKIKQQNAQNTQKKENEKIQLSFIGLYKDHYVFTYMDKKYDIQFYIIDESSMTGKSVEEQKNIFNYELKYDNLREFDKKPLIASGGGRIMTRSKRDLKKRKRTKNKQLDTKFLKKNLKSNKKKKRNSFKNSIQTRQINSHKQNKTKKLSYM